jgi:hypothetical protein
LRLSGSYLDSPIETDLVMFKKTGNMPDYSTFLDGDAVKVITRNVKPMFDTVAVIDISKLGPNLVAELDSAKGHVSIKL